MWTEWFWIQQNDDLADLMWENDGTLYSTASKTNKNFELD